MSANHFTCLERNDLREHRDACFVEATLLPRGGGTLGLGDGDVVLAGLDNDNPEPLFQAVIADYDYCVDEGSSWWLVPLSFGPVQEIDESEDYIQLPFGERNARIVEVSRGR